MTPFSTQSAVVLLSGGQDSATCLAWALTHFETVHTLGFDYGQRHAIELEARKDFRLAASRWADAMRKSHAHDLFIGNLGSDHLLPLPALNMVAESALTRDTEISAPADALPNTFVPGRNLLFVTLAAALAWKLGAQHVVTGVCETDFSGYPDCRDDTIKALQVAINLGMDRRFVIHTPLMWLSKADTWALAHRLGGQELVSDIVKRTHTCYRGDHTTEHEWGYGCGECPACQIRARGWHEWVASL